MPAKHTLHPDRFIAAIRSCARGHEFVPRREIQLQVGASVWAISRTANALYQRGKIERRWISHQWWYREA